MSERIYDVFVKTQMGTKKGSISLCLEEDSLTLYLVGFASKIKQVEKKANQFCYAGTLNYLSGKDACKLFFCLEGNAIKGWIQTAKGNMKFYGNERIDIKQEASNDW